MGRRDVGASRLLALVPAAGRSLRMGRSKPLVALGHSDFIGTLVAALGDPAAGVGRVVVVHRADDLPLLARVTALGREGAGPPLLPVPVSGDGDMLTSLRAGWAIAKEEPGALIWPVDAPLAARDTLLAVLRCARETPWRVVRPSHDGRPGHPLWVPAEVLSSAPLPGAEPGLRGLIDALDPDPLDLPVSDPGCLLNLNTPEALEIALQERP